MTLQWRQRPFRALLWGMAGLLAITVAASIVWRFLLTGPRTRPYDRIVQGSVAESPISPESESRIKAFCGDCHAVPRPESFHRDLWHEEVLRGYEFYVRSGRNDLDPPPIHETVAYFRARAPERMAYPQPKEAETPLGVSFSFEKVPLDALAGLQPAIAHLCWTRLPGEKRPFLLACDMLSGQILAVDLRDPKRTIRTLARLNNPCHIEPCDLDQDGTPDLLIADLGSFPVIDHDHGRVVWLRGSERTGAFEEVVLASGLGRVDDVRPGDFDGDGKLDLIVAEFGLLRTGSILLLRNVAPRGQRPRFVPERIDPRTGTTTVAVHDFNGDGRPDFAALVSNENECVDLFLNQGSGKFYRETLFKAPDLTYGSNTMELVDLNGDGKMDILWTNGDAFDNNYVTPWHGVQWLENRGNGQFEYRRIADMPGACRALTGDFDGDGDLDILVVSLLPPGAKPETLDEASQPSILLLEQTAPGHFVRHTLERGFGRHAAIAIADFDGDGNLDFAVGTFLNGRVDTPYRLAVWWNRGREAPGSKRR